MNFMESGNQTLELKGGLRSVLVLLIFLTGFGIGVVITSNKISSMMGGSGSADLAAQIVDNPVILGSTVDGVLKSKDETSLVLEKEGKQLKIFIDDKTEFMKSPDSSQAFSAPNGFKESLDNIKVGADLAGSVLIKKDKNTSQVTIVGISFLVKP